MKKISVNVMFDEEKLAAAKMYMAQRELDVRTELEKALDGMYNSYEAAGREGYAKYIALRPRAERIGTHGLFTDDGVEVNLSKVADEMNAHRGNIWTIIDAV